MKYKKILGLSALSLAFIGLWGCTEELDYSPAERLTDAQVFFASDAVSSVSLEDGQNTAVVYVNRANTSGSVTVNVTSSAVAMEDGEAVPTGLFFVPSAVTFADGQSSTPITISFDFNEIKAETNYVLTLDISGDGLSPYGKKQHDVTIAYAPWSQWKSIGDAFYTNAAPFGFADANPVQKRNSLLSPHLVQYSLVKMFSNSVDTYIDVDESTGLVTVARQKTSSTSGGFIIEYCDSYTFYTKVSSSSNPEVYKGRSTFDKDNGLITINIVFFIIRDNGSIGWWGADNYDTVQLPGYPNYDITVTNAGTYINEAGQEFTVLNVLKGSDVASYAIKLLEGALSEEQAGEEADKIIEDTSTVLYTENREFQFPVSKEDYYTCVTVSYGSDGLPKGHNSYTFYNELNQVDWNKGWTVVTEAAKFTDVFFAGIWWANLNSWNVEVQQKDDVPGYYRIVKPYGLNPYDEPTERGHYYVTIDATDPEAVQVLPSLTSYGYYVVSSAPGKLVDGSKFVFPANSLGVVNGYDADGSMIVLANYGKESVLLDLDSQANPGTKASPALTGLSKIESSRNIYKNLLMPYKGKRIMRQPVIFK